LTGRDDERALQRHANAIRLNGLGPFRVVVKKGRNFTARIRMSRSSSIAEAFDRGSFCGNCRATQRRTPSIAPADAAPAGFREECAAPATRNLAVTVAPQRISAAALRTRVDTLAALRTRHARLPAFEPALAICKEWRAEANYEVERLELPIPRGRTANAIGSRRGRAADRELFVVGAHLDSIDNEDGPDAAALGAADNASGSATVGATANAICSTTFSASSCSAEKKKGCSAGSSS
jgi:hypothetical protein